MNFYKNGKDTYFCDDPRFLITKEFNREWSIFRATDIPGRFQYVVSFHYLRDAKAEVKRLSKAEVKKNV